MISEYSLERLRNTPPGELGDQLEQGEIVFFPECPVALPDSDDLDFFREQLPELLALKNVSYHPETDRVRLKGAPELADRARQILKTHSERVVAFLHQTMPSLTDGFTSIIIGDTSAGTGTVDIDTATFLDPATIAGGVIHDSAGTEVWVFS